MCKLNGRSSLLRTASNLEWKCCKTCGEKKDSSMVHFYNPFDLFFTVSCQFIYNNCVWLRRLHTKESCVLRSVSKVRETWGHKRECSKPDLQNWTRIRLLEIPRAQWMWKMCFLIFFFFHFSCTSLQSSIEINGSEALPKSYISQCLFAQLSQTLTYFIYVFAKQHSHWNQWICNIAQK